MTGQANLDNPNAVFTLGQVDPAYREQYKRVRRRREPGGVAAARLHRLPRAGRAAGTSRSRSSRHCQGCHAQTVSGLQSPAGVTTEPFTVPHGRPAAELDRLIRAELLRQIDAQKKLLRTVPLPPPDRLDPPRAAVPSDLGKEADALTKLATGLLTCTKCHEVNDGRIRPTGTPALWLPAAKFDHPAHRAVNCAECHNTWDRGGRLSAAAGPEPLNVPGIDNCRQCHAPATPTSTAAVRHGCGPAAWQQLGLPSPGGVRHECVDCHRYLRPGHP